MRPGQKPFMSLEEFQKLCADANLISENFAARDCDLFFNLSMMTQIDELTKDRHFQMQFVEFMEAIARVAWQAKVPEPTKENLVQAGTVAKYLENIMPQLVNLCPKDVVQNFRYPTSSPFYKAAVGRGRRSPF